MQGDLAMADLLHVTCGECQGIPIETRRTMREIMSHSLRNARKAVIGNGKRNLITHGKAIMIERIAAAQRALAKTTKRATVEEKDALRAWMAGHLPQVGGDNPKKMKYVTQIMIREIKETQQAAANLRNAWKEAGKEENVRRATREGGKEGTRWRGIGFDQWQHSMQRKQQQGYETQAYSELYRIKAEVRSRAAKKLGANEPVQWKEMTWEARLQHVHEYMETAVKATTTTTGTEETREEEYNDPIQRKQKRRQRR